MTVEIRDLRWAVVVSQHRSLRQAAERLNIRQSTLSRCLKDMENRLGVELFERSNGGTRPTVAGREFLVSAVRILAETDSALRKLQTRSRGENGRLSIGIYASLSTGNMYATLAEHHRRFPEVEVHTVDGDHCQLMYALSINTVDVAVMTATRSGWDDRALPLWSERVIVALHDGHPLAAKQVIYWPELTGETVIIPHSGTGPELERLLRAKLGDCSLGRFLHQESGLDRLLSLVSAEFGVLPMLEGATGVRFDNVTYREVHDTDGPTRLNFAAYWRQSNGNPTLTPFIAMLRQRYPDLSVRPASD
ncbi:LysR family transcriptional regulator [Xanthobacter sp. V0B-10]|uniref:LysR substrate-binding domain-containing protein n=1 Tax=Xanthobacter albus TaxID=3119929 RepID=UPI00372C43F0